MKFSFFYNNKKSNVLKKLLCITAFCFCCITTLFAQANSAQIKNDIDISNPNQIDVNGVSLLMKAAKSGNDWELNKLIKSGADIQLRDKDGWTALMYAVRYQNDSQIVKLLIQNGAYVRVRNKFNLTPLLLTANYTQNPNILSLLLENRTNIDEEVFHAFILAITGDTQADYIKLAKLNLFLEKGISVNRVWNSKTPLMYACENATSTSIIELLLKNGALTSPRDKDGKTAFDYAKENPNIEHNEIYWKLNN